MATAFKFIYLHSIIHLSNNSQKLRRTIDSIIFMPGLIRCVSTETTIPFCLSPGSQSQQIHWRGGQGCNLVPSPCVGVNSSGSFQKRISLGSSEPLLPLWSKHQQRYQHCPLLLSICHCTSGGWANPAVLHHSKDRPESSLQESPSLLCKPALPQNLLENSYFLQQGSVIQSQVNNYHLQCHGRWSLLGQNLLQQSQPLSLLGWLQLLVN